MSKILAVTGATGKKSGGEFMRVLNLHREELDGWKVRAIVRPTSNISELKSLELNPEIYTGQLTDNEFMLTAFKGVDTVVHIVAITLSNAIIDAAIKSGVRRVILVHTTGIYSKHKEAGELYRKIDADVEKKCREHNILLTILRPTMIYGNTNDNNVIEFVKMVYKFPIMPVVNGARYELQPVHYKDLAIAYYQVFKNEEATANKNFDLSGGEPILLRDMFIEIGKNMGKKTKFISCPYFIAYTGACMIYFLTLKKKDYREKVQRLCEPRVYSHEEAAKAFGYAPRNFEVGIVDEVKQFLETKQK